MRLNLAALLAFSATALANVEVERRETAFDMASALSQASVLRTLFGTNVASYTMPFVTPGGNMLQPPASIVGAIITGVPASVLVELAKPSGRSSIASEFAAGNTPMWYQTLPPPVKSYIESLNTQIRKGDVDLSATPSAFSFPVTDTAGSATAKSNAAASSTSKADAAQVTGDISLSLAAAIGILGVVIAL